MVDELLRYWPFIAKNATHSLREAGVLTSKQVALPQNIQQAKLIACGWWGCVWECTHNPRFIIKLTFDPIEGPVTAKILHNSRLRYHPGTVYYHDLWAIPILEGEKHVLPPKFMSIERIDDTLGYLIVRENAPPPKDFVEDIRYLNDSKLLNLKANSYFQSLSDREQQARIEWLQVLEILRSIPEAASLAEFIQLADELEGIILRDIHLGNIGQREYTFEDLSRRIKKHGQLLLIDAGHAGIKIREEPALQIAKNPHELQRIKYLDLTL